MRVLVIGGTKFIGAHVVNQLARAGHRVTVYHRGETETPLPETVRHVHSGNAAIPVTSFPEEIFVPAPDVLLHMIAMGENDTRAAVESFRGRVSRAVWISSGDVYRAYGRFIGTEPGPVDPGLLTEESPLRSVLFPYPSQPAYEKILMERIATGEPGLPATILRLPKVYGHGSNAELATVYGFREQPQWRW